MAKIIKTLYKDDNYNSVHLCEGNRIKISIPGRGISKPIENWVTDDVEYTNRLLVKRINELEAELRKQ